MTTAIFVTWLRKLNYQMKQQRRRILLLLNNSGSHPYLHLSNVKLVFLPPYTTSRLQPVDAGIIQAVKMRCRKMLLRHILHYEDEASSASDVAEQVTVLEAVLWMRSSWDAISEETMRKCFLKCGIPPSAEAAPDLADESDTTHKKPCAHFFHPATI